MVKEDPYARYLIKQYGYWKLQIYNDHQRYLGRSIAWLDRESEMEEPWEVRPWEQDELWRVVIPEWANALKRLWRPIKFNVDSLGNSVELHGGHCHWHLVPRYDSPREFAGHTFIDEKWGSLTDPNWAPCNRFKVSEEVLFKIRDALKEAIE